MSTTSAARVAPHNLEAEEALLGAMLLSADARNAAFDETSADAFYRPIHGHIFEAIRSVAAAGEMVDPVTVADQLGRDGLLDAVGGLAALLSLQANTPATSNAARYARIVDEHGRLRRLIGVAGEIAELGYSAPDDVDEAVDRAETLLFAAADARRSGPEAPTLAESLPGYLERLEARGGDGVPGVLTGFHDLDEKLAGLRGGQLITVGARTSMGKSLFGGNLAMNAAAAGHPTLFWSLEMSSDELHDRFVASTARVDLQRIRLGRLTDHDWTSIANTAVPRLSEMPLHVVADSNATVMSIRSKARRVAARYGKLGLLVVDYMQLVEVARKRENRQVEVSEISRGLKRLADELDAPVVALAQLSRNLEMRADKRPMLSDLRESGSIEQDSHTVLFLYRDEYYYGNDSPDRGICEVIVAKQRNGPLGTVKLAYMGRHGTFANMARMDGTAA